MPNERLPDDASVSANKLQCSSGFIHSSSRVELNCVSEKNDQTSRKDFISHLPIELSLDVFNYLSPKDLFSCAQVSRTWYRLSNDPTLWFKICQLHYCSPSHSNNVIRIKNRLTSNSSSCHTNWKQVYRQFMQTECNWRCSGPTTKIVIPAHLNHIITCLEVYDKWVISGSSDSSICVWSLTTGHCLINLFGHLGGVWSLVILPPKHINANDFADMTTVVGAGDTIPGNSAESSDSRLAFPLLVSGSADGTARVWQLDNDQWPCITTLFGHHSIVRCLAGRKLSYKVDDGENVENEGVIDGNYEHRLKYSKVLLQNMNLVVTGSRDTTLRLWNVITGECLQHFQGHRGAIRCVQFTGFHIASGSYDCTVRLWCALTGTCLHEFFEHTNRVYTLLFNGLYIISASLDTTIRVWKSSSFKLEHTFSGHRSLITHMELRDCDNILISSNADETVRVWDIKSGQCLHTLAGANKHQAAVTSVQVMHKFIVSSGIDGTVKLWDLQTGCFLRDILKLDGAGRGGMVWKIVISDDRLICAAGSRNGMEPTKLILFDFNDRTVLNNHSNSNNNNNDDVKSRHKCKPKQMYAPVPRLSQLLLETEY